MRAIEINNRIIPTFIIAEAGVNHNGDIDIAKRLIDVAKETGADAVKFQTFKADKLVTHKTCKAKYQIQNMGTNESQFEMLQEIELPFSAYKELFDYAVEKNIIFLSTPFDNESCDFLEDIGMEIFKIPSGEITNKPFIQHIAAKNKPIILSTGMSYIGEVEKALGWINHIWGKQNKKILLTLLHCVSNYPASIEDINLLAMKTLKNAFGLPVGYSDHTIGIEIPIAAVALGASIIEKHFTLDRNMKGPDHKISLEPDELRAMITSIRNVEKAIGDGIKKPTVNEEDTRDVVRRSLIASKDISRDHIITEDDIVIKRPGTGIPPEFKELIIGMQSKRDIKFDSVIKWEDLKNA